MTRQAALVREAERDVQDGAEDPPRISRAQLKPQLARGTGRIFPVHATTASLIAFALGLVPTLLSRQKDQWVGAAACMMVGLAAWAVGGLTGFLFGISLASAEPVQSPPPPGGGRQADTTQPAGQQAKNTALQEISSWLTRIIVGAGLVNLGELVEWIGALGVQVGALMMAGTGSANGTLGAATIVYFTIIGFISVYTYARTVLNSSFAQSDQETYAILVASQRELTEKIEAQNEKVEQISTVQEESVKTLEAQAKTFTSRVAELGEKNKEAALEQNNRFVESQMLSALYSPPPGGYAIAIELAGQAQPLSPRGHYYLACAYGQKLQHEKPGAEEASRLRQQAYEQLQDAAVDDTVRELARRALHNQLGPEEDDLLVFRGDPAFEELLGT